MAERVHVAGIPVDNLDIDEALAAVEGFVASRTPHMGVAINPEKVIKAKQDKALEKVLRKSDLNFCDGIGIMWASRVFYHERIKSRVTGVDLFLRILELADARGWRLFLLGSRPETLSRVVTIVKERYPGLVVAGSHDGYFTAADEPGLVTEIAAARADIIFVGMGSPKQEKFLAGNLSAMGVPFAMGVGGSYNVLSGEFKRAPARVQRLGLEWLYRFVLDPKRLPRILSLPRFVGIVLRSPREHIDNIDFFGISISNRDIDELLEIADGFVESRVPHLVVTLNGEMAARAFRDAEFLEIVQQADLVVADGVGIVWGARMLGPRIENRIPGIEFSGSLLALAELKGYRVYFLGAKPDIVERAASNVMARYPGLHVAGFHSGYFDAAEEAHVIQEILGAHVDILLVGMGGGAQEKWIWHHRDMGIPIAIGVGGTFDVWSGLVRRAPRFVQKTGTEWLYRLVVQPSRVRRVGSIFYFMFRVLAHRRTASRSQITRILVLGYYGFGSFGDELILSAVQDELTSIKCEAVFAVNEPGQYASPLCPRHTFVDRHDQAAMRTALRACDHVMLGGGGLIQDVTSWRSSLYYLGIPLLAVLYKKGIISYAQGVGPVRRLWIRRLVRTVFGRMILIDVRDDASRDLLLECGVRTQDICVSSDAGLSYLLARGGEPVAATRREPHIVACVNKRFGWTPEETASFLDCLGSQSSARLDLVVLFPSADLAFTRAVRDRLLTPSELIISPQPLGLLGLCSSAMLTVAGRYHMAAAAVAARSPLVALAYDPKVSQLADTCGFDAFQPGDSPQQAAGRVRPGSILPVTKESIQRIGQTRTDRIARLKAVLERRNP